MCQAIKQGGDAVYFSQEQKELKLILRKFNCICKFWQKRSFD